MSELVERALDVISEQGADAGVQVVRMAKTDLATRAWSAIKGRIPGREQARSRRQVRRRRASSGRRLAGRHRGGGALARGRPAGNSFPVTELGVGYRQRDRTSATVIAHGDIVVGNKTTEE